jgi:hypothetical protein
MKKKRKEQGKAHRGIFVAANIWKVLFKERELPFDGP